MLVSGRLPFNEANDSETLTKILDCSFRAPAHISSPCKESGPRLSKAPWFLRCSWLGRVISRLLVRDPAKRAPVSEIADMEWVKGGHKGHAQLLPLVSRNHVGSTLPLMSAGERAFGCAGDGGAARGHHRKHGPGRSGQLGNYPKVRHTSTQNLDATWCICAEPWKRMSTLRSQPPTTSWPSACSSESGPRFG